jgi:ABC-type branched-subunit amino acid transport system ATPase component/ABC-type branched-subunit amino acid transport system permease subunit
VRSEALRVSGRVVANPIVHTVVVTALLIFIGLSFGAGSYYGYLITIAVLYGVAAIGLNVPAGLLGQMSLGQGASMAVGAYAAAILIVDHKWPLLPTLIFCLVIGFLVGVLMAIPAARLGLIGLAIVTLGFTLIVSDIIISQVSLTGGVNGKLGIYAAVIHGNPLSSRGIFFVVVITCALTYLAHWRLRVSTFGRSCLAVRDEELGAAALGISSYTHVVLGFGIGSGVGAVAGGLYAVVSSVITPDAFGTQLSILILLMVIFGGPGTRFGPVIGAAVIGLLPILLSNDPTTSVYLYGGILIISMRILPRGLFPRTAAPIERRSWRRTTALHGPEPVASAAPPGNDRPSLAATSVAASEQSATILRDTPVLDVSDVSRSFGGVQAVSHADLTIHRGEVVAIIGSNGSGKTTLLNLVCGYYRAETGHVRLAGADITSTRARNIARRGVSRTFQVPKVFPSLSIEEHLALARARATRHDPMFEQVALDFLQATGLNDNPKREARTLAHGSLRFLEVAMAVLRTPEVLLLDEPAAGLSGDEMLRLGDLIRRLAALGVGVALIEHHLDWVRSVADRIIVMHLGEQIWDGSPDELMHSDVVRDAYLLGVANG